MSANVPPIGSPEPKRKQRSALVEKLATPKVIIGALITALALWFIIANNSKVRIHLWVVWINAQLWLVLLLTFVAGALVGLLFARRRNRAKRR